VRKDIVPMKQKHNDKRTMAEINSSQDRTVLQQNHKKSGLMIRFLNWIERGAKKSCPT
jgi:hypothetical protein